MAAHRLREMGSRIRFVVIYDSSHDPNCGTADGRAGGPAACRVDDASTSNSGSGRVQLRGTVQCFPGETNCFFDPSGKKWALAVLPEPCRPLATTHATAPSPDYLFKSGKTGNPGGIIISSDGTVNLEGNGKDTEGLSCLTLDDVSAFCRDGSTDCATGWGVAFLVTIAVASTLYVGGGVGYGMKAAGAAPGLGAHPHLVLWQQLGGLVIDGLAFARAWAGGGTGGRA